MPKLIIVAAIAENGTIGHEGRLPWGRSLPRDMARFRQLTLKVGNVLMGRKTADSLGKPLPNRQNFVMTHDEQCVPPGFIWMPHLCRLGMYLGPQDVVAVVGGAEIYRLAAPYASLAYLTRVRTAYKGDTFYPIDSLTHYTRKGALQELSADAENKHAMTFITLQNNKREELPESVKEVS